MIRRYVWQPESLGYDVPLSVFDAAADATYFYHTDANKNVTELSDVSGNVVAHYEYSPFGETVKSEGAYAESNPFRFSSEYHDGETGLVYYNYRYYHPTLGRWISKDPIEEKGGYNLYNMVGNSPVDLWDDLGQGHNWWCWLLNNLKKSWENTTRPFEDATQKVADTLVEVNDPRVNKAIDFVLDNDISIQLGGYADYAFVGGAGVAIEFDYTKNGAKINVNFDSNLGYGASAGGYASTSFPSSYSLPYVSAGSGFSVKGPIGASFNSGGGRNGIGISVGTGFGSYGTISNNIR